MQIKAEYTCNFRDYNAKTSKLFILTQNTWDWFQQGNRIFPFL